MNNAERTTAMLELSNAIERVKSARGEVRLALNPTDEDLARHHLNLAVGHLAKLTKLHKEVDTWKPKKAAKKKNPSSGHLLTPAQSNVPGTPSGSYGAPTDASAARRPVLSRRAEYRGQSETRTRGCVAGGEKQHRAASRVVELRGLRGTIVEIVGEPIIYSRDAVISDPWGSFLERMLPGCATHLLSSDVRLLLNHDGLPLARVPATMTLTDSRRALRMSANIDTRMSAARDAVCALERGDLTGMSASWVVAEDWWAPDYLSRQVQKLDSLLDVSLVTYPAYESTSASVGGMSGRVT